MTKEEVNLIIDYHKRMQEDYIEGEGYERHPLPEWYALDKAIEFLEQKQWIPVRERLPEEETDVLVCSETGAIAVCCGSYSTEVCDTFIWYTEGWRFGKVIAWMPLPEPYEAESEEEA